MKGTTTTRQSVKVKVLELHCVMPPMQLGWSMKVKDVEIHWLMSIIQTRWSVKNEISKRSLFDIASVNELMVKMRKEYKDIGVSLGKTIDIQDNSVIRNGYNRARDDVMIKDLLHYPQMSSPNFMWDEIDGETFIHITDCCYTETVQWRRSLFKIPSGKAGKAFVQELNRLFCG